MNSTLYLDKKIVVFDSDDWGMLGMHDLESFERLKAKGYNQLGQSDWDYYSLETKEDLDALYSVLSKHKDAFGLPPIFTCNFIVANPDFEKIIKSGFEEFHSMSLSQGFPGMWGNRGQLLNVYKAGIDRGLVYPGYHGLCHLNYEAWLAALRNGEPDLLDCIKEHIRYIPSMRDRDFSYDYIASIDPFVFLSLKEQEERIKNGISTFKKMFGQLPVVTTAPKCAWNSDTEKIWHKYGIKYIGAGNRRLDMVPDNRLGERNQWDMIYLTRNVHFEPVRKNACQDAIIEIDFLFKAQQPAIIETHSINFHSSIKDFREKSLESLDQLLYLIETKYPDVVYLTCQQLGEILEQGFCYLRNGECMDVKTHRINLPYLAKFHFNKKKAALKRYFQNKIKSMGIVDKL